MTKHRKFKRLMAGAPAAGPEREKWLKAQPWYWEFMAWALGNGGKVVLDRAMKGDK
jgi:hypothetical protein